MRIMFRTFMLVALLVGLTWSQVGLAADVPATAKKNDDLSNIALTKAKEVFAAQKASLQKQLETDEALPEDQKMFIESLLAKAEQQLNTLASMEVYFVEEGASGEAYDSVVEYYQSKLNHFTNVGTDELSMMLFAPVEVLPEATRTTLEKMIDDGSARAAAGTAGSSRVSMMTFYVNPDTLELIHQTTIVVATTK